MVNSISNIQYTHFVPGQIHDIKADTAQYHLVPVSLDGKLPEWNGKGSCPITRQYAQKFPGWVAGYQRACRETTPENERLVPGKILFSMQPACQHIALFPVQYTIDGGVDAQLIELGLQKLVNLIELGQSDNERRQFSSIATPKLGCGHLGSNWDTFGPMMARYFLLVPKVEFHVYIGQAHRDKMYPEIEVVPTGVVEALLEAYKIVQDVKTRSNKAELRKNADLTRISELIQEQEAALSAAK